MTEIKTKRADLIFKQMMMTDAKVISDVTQNIMNAVEDEDVHNQILGVASTLLCLLDEYSLDHTDVLAEANNIIFSGEYNNMLPEFKNVITQFIKEKWEMN